MLCYVGKLPYCISGNSFLPPFGGHLKHSRLWVLWAVEKEHSDKQDEDVSRGGRGGPSATVGIDGMFLVNVSLSRAGRWPVRWVEEGREGEREQVPRLGWLSEVLLSFSCSRSPPIEIFAPFFFSKKKKRKKKNVIIKEIMVVDTPVFHDVPGTGSSLSIFAHFN